MNLLLMQFNNYFNRTIKIYKTIDDYKSHSLYYGFQLNVNFNPNEGVNAEQVVNWNEEFVPDYLVCFNEDNEIVYRWFIVAWQRLRNGQYKAKLKRDSVSDNFDIVVESPCFIEKAMARSINDVCIYNSEGNTYNQIKTSEALIKDETKVGWIVGYMAHNTPDTNITVVNTETNFIEAPSRSSWEYNQYENNFYNHVIDKQMFIKTLFSNAGGSQRYETETIETFTKTGTSNVVTSLFAVCGKVYDLSDCTVSQSMIEYIYSSYLFSIQDNLWNKFFENQTDYHQNNILESLNGRFIHFIDDGEGNDGGFFQIVINETSGSMIYSSSAGDATEQAVCGEISFDQNGVKYEYNPTGGVTSCLRANLTLKKLKISLVPVSFESLTTKISANANRLTDAPYKMFAIPYGKLKVTIGNTIVNTLDELSALNVATTIAKSLDNYLYDIQLLPYCPIRGVITNDGIDISNLDEETDWNEIDDETENFVGIILYPKYSRFTFDINYSITKPTNVMDFKKENETAFYRLMSPNGASQFDFKITKTGSISKINVDCTYKPYSPYIHLNPNWKNLYGTDYNDYRGLICQGDFSIPVVNDQWKNYQINNKNYLNAFNRETDTLEKTYDINRKMNEISAVTSALSSGISGATGGALVGGPAGAIAGGVLGASASLLGGMADLYFGQQLHNEQMDYRKDQFSYNMQNIQARPNTLAKIGGLDYNNKVFPYLEYYESTDEELDILEEKIKYEGMTIMVISTIANYITNEETYIRGKIIKLDGLNGEYQLANDIKQEIMLGIRVKNSQTQFSGGRRRIL